MSLVCFLVLNNVNILVKFIYWLMFVFNFITVVDKCYDGFDSLFIIMAGQCRCQY